MTSNDLYTILVEYVKQNKDKYNIDYIETIDFIKELLRDIEKDYENIEEGEN